MESDGTSEDSISYDKTSEYSISPNESNGNSLAFDLLDEDHPFKHLLFTNKEPSTEEIKAVFRQISHSDHRLEMLQKEIRELRQRIEDLEDQNVKEQRRNRSYRHILAPVKRIPDEMLGEIFKHLHSVDEGFPPSVSLVCSRWRQVILKTPRLWTTITIFPTSNSIELAKISAIRCGPALPMRIIMHDWESADNHSLKLDWLVPYRPRIQKFAVSTCNSIYDMDAPMQLPLINGGSFDSLEELELDVDDDDNWEGVKLWFWNSSMKADSLKKLRLVNMGLPPTDLGISLDRLTHLFLQDGFGSGAIRWNLRQILLFFANHPQLQTVELQNVTEDYGATGGSEFIAGLPESPPPTTTQPSQYPSAESERIALPNLESLSIDFGRGTNWFLDRLTLPVLKHLTLSGAVCWVSSFQGLAERSSFSLETFAMAECTPFHDNSGNHADPARNSGMQARSKIRQQQVVDVLKSCPTIRQFKAIDSLFLGTYLVEKLRHKKDGTSLLGPNLEHLCVGDTETYRYYDQVVNNLKMRADGDQILRMLDSRRPDGKAGEMYSRSQKLKFYQSGSPTIPISGMSWGELNKQYNQYRGDAFLASRHVFF